MTLLKNVHGSLHLTGNMYLSPDQAVADEGNIVCRYQYAMYGPGTPPRRAELKTTSTPCPRARRSQCFELDTAGCGGHLNSAALHELGVDLSEAVIEAFHLKAPPPCQRPCHKTAHQGKSLWTERCKPQAHLFRRYTL